MSSVYSEVYPFIKILSVAALAFILAFALTPLWTKFLYRYMRSGKQIRDDGKTPVFSSLHKKKEGTPVMGGLIVWFAVLVLIVVIWLFAKYTSISLFHDLNFLTRQQTLLPLGALVASALVGAIDDVMGVKRIGSKGGGLKMRHRLVLYTLIAVVGAWWFYSKLGFDIIHIPAVGDFHLGLWYIPLFIIVIVATSFSVNETDGLDGLAGGVLLSSFAAYGVICFIQGRIDLATFCFAIAGALLAFLWFNIHPARFFMGDTGSMALGTTLGVIAMLTNTALVLPFIGIIFVAESLSVIIQVASKKLRHGKKVFLSAPFHHHFEAKGWPETKVTERFWIVSAVAAFIGVVIAILGRGN